MKNRIDKFRITAALFFAVVLLAGCGGGGGNIPPVANAGSLQNVTTGTPVTLDGSASSDANSDPLTYSWTLTGKPAGSTATLTGAATVVPTFSADVGGTYIASLVVNDGTVNSAPATVTINAIPPVNVDTGITASQCFQAGSDVLVACNSAAALALNPAQDGMLGRDVSANNAADGKLGFSYSVVPGGCVQDNVTGLMWEVKTTDGGLRDWTKTYTNRGDNSPADASTFVAALNASNLCGFNDWRLPTADELQSIVDYSVAWPGPTIDTSWFPNTQQSAFWSSSHFAPYPNHARYVTFYTGVVSNDNFLYSSYYVRLVRGGQSQTQPRYTISADGSEVTDLKTGLIWMRCVLGKSWNGTTCAGWPYPTSQGFALQEAAALAAISGVAWRLPNVKELSSIADKSGLNPVIDSVVFPATPSGWFWSSSPFAGYLHSGWVVSFQYGYVYGYARDAGYFVRLVRAGQ